MVREGAQRERRSISAYVLNVVLRAVEMQEKYLARIDRLAPFPRYPLQRPRTCILVRCSREEGSRIRAAAMRRDMTMCSYVLHTLERSWHLGG